MFTFCLEIKQWKECDYTNNKDPVGGVHKAPSLGIICYYSMKQI